MRAPTWLVVGVLAGCLVGCGNDEKKGDGPSKEDYDAAAGELADHVGLISLYVPYLDPPKADGKYDPRPTARDVQPRQERAANAIRMTATAARQRTKSPVIKLLEDAFANVGRACTRAEGEDAIKKCKDAINALDAELEKQGKAASEAGATAKIPRIGADAVTDKAKKDFEPFLKALGPTPKEVETLKGLEDPKADVMELAAKCDMAAEEQKTVEATYQGVDEELRKLAVKHRFAIEAICRTMKRVEASRVELGPCKEEKKLEDKECVLACSKAKNLVKEGMPTAAQESFPEYYKEICEPDEDK